MIQALLAAAMTTFAAPLQTMSVQTEVVQNEPTQEEAVPEEAVIVRVKRLSKPFANVSFDRMDIYTNPASKADALLAVADLQFATNNNNAADIVLRGGSSKLSRVYFNDVPIYEAVRGSTSLTTTRGFSIFNTSTIKSVETYSSAPPSYFANTAGGVIHILPDDDGNDSASFEINSTKIGFDFTRQLPSKNGSFLQIYGERKDLEPLLQTNPKLGKLVQFNRGLNLGINGLFRANENQEWRVLALNDIDDGLYPFSRFDATKTLNNKKRRSYNIVSFEQSLGDARLKLDVAKTYVRETNDFGRDVFVNNNQYSYLDANIAGRMARLKLSYRFGVTFEDFNLKSDARFSRPIIGFAGDFQSRAHAKYSAYYAFATYQPFDGVSLAIGGRGYFENDLGLAPTVQISAALNSPDERHKLIAAYGQYGAIVLPTHSAFEPLLIAKSGQASLDYKYINDTTNFAFGLYQKIDDIGTMRTKISGFDLSYGFMLGENIEVSGTMARSLPYELYNSQKQRSENHLDYLFKLKTKFGLGSGRSLNFNYTAMSGSVYSLPISTTTDRLGDLVPIYGKRNTEQMSAFASLDVNYIQRLKISADLQPIAYININNLLDKKNQSEVRFDESYTQHRFAHYLPRTVVVGLLFSY